MQRPTVPLSPGDVVIAEFPGASGIKRRPAVVLSTSSYHQHRPDLVVGLLTTQTRHAVAPSDCIVQDWRAAGLDAESAFRSYLATLRQTEVVSIGRLSDRDWLAVCESCRRAVGICL